jgi:Tfp pilus assembly PilM family ATPase
LARFLALDWDQNQLHVVQAEVRGSTVRVQRASLWHQEGTPNPAQAEEMGKKLRERLKEAGMSSAPVLACVGRDRLIVKEIRIPPVPEAEEPSVVRFQAIKELTDAPDDVILDYTINMLPSTSLSGDRKAVALVVRKELLDTYQTVCQAAGLKLAALTPRVIGTAACLRQVMGTTVVTPAPDPADGTIAIVVVGDRAAEICVVRGSTFLLARSIPVAANLAGEVRRNLAVHAGQAPQHPVRAVYVTGKGSGELRERLSELTDIPVHTFDPFAGSELPELPAGQRGTFAGAVGLLHAKAAGELPINFVAPRQPRPPQNPNYGRIRFALVAGITLVIGLFVLGRVLHASWKDELDSLKANHQEIETRLKAVRANSALLKQIDDWDTLVLLDELHDLAARIPSVNALRITSFQADALPRNNPKMKSRFVARATINGKLLDRREPRKAFNEFVETFSKESYYSVDSYVVNADNTFTLVVSIERRAPGDYKRTIKVEDPPVIKGLPPKGKSGEGDKAGEGGDKGKADAEAVNPPENEGRGKFGKGKFGKGKRGGM